MLLTVSSVSLSPVSKGRNEVGVTPTLLGQPCCEGAQAVGCRWGGSTRQQCLLGTCKKGEKSVGQSSWVHSLRDPTGGALSPSPARRVTFLPRRAGEKAQGFEQDGLSGVHFSTAQSSTGTENGLFPALHSTATNVVQLGQTPTALAPCSLNALRSSQPPKHEAQTSWEGLWSGGLWQLPTWHRPPSGIVCPTPMIIQCQERQ